MSKPIIVKAWKRTGERALVEEEWTYERILELWDNDTQELTPQLVLRCQEYEKRLKEIATVWTCYKDFLQAKYPVDVKKEWKFTCPYHQTIDKLCQEENYV